MKFTELSFDQFKMIIKRVFNQVEEYHFEIYKKTKNYKVIIPFEYLFTKNNFKINKINSNFNPEDITDLSEGLNQMLQILFNEKKEFDEIIIYRSDTLTLNNNPSILLSDVNIIDTLVYNYSNYFSSNFVFDICMDDIYFIDVKNYFFYAYEHPGIMYSVKLPPVLEDLDQWCFL